MNADLSNADLSYANLMGANLMGANLSERTYRGEPNELTAPEPVIPSTWRYGMRTDERNLANANLTGANLSGANLWGRS
jgi:uncharacterized protein YjbI with pentapeptide repeats